MRGRLKAYLLLQVTLLMQMHLALGAPRSPEDALEDHEDPQVEYISFPRTPRKSRSPGSNAEVALHAKRYVDAQQNKQAPPLEELDFNFDDESRYIGFCKNAFIRMWPGNSRKFWSYGYVYLKQDYLANCSMHYYYNTRQYPNDSFRKFGFRVKGHFYGLSENYTHCTDTDYVFLNDSNGNEAYYCGPYIDIDWTTSEDTFEFHFITKENSPRAKGFWTRIESYELCGGLYTVALHGPTGSFQTPHFPENYPDNLACYWYFDIPVAEGHEVSTLVKCSTFSFPGKFDNGTHQLCLDAVQFTFEAPYDTETQSYCSNTLNDTNRVIYSTHNPMLVAFKSDSSVTDIGFNCTYEFILFGE